MDKLKQEFQNYSFDIKEPSEAHFERFQKKLEATKKKPLKKRWLWVKYASSIAAVLLLSLVFYLPTQEHSENQQCLSAMSPKMYELQMYFKANIQKRLQKIQKEKDSSVQIIVRDAVLELEKLEQVQKKICFDLSNTNQNKRVMTAMIFNYQSQINFLDDVYAQIENVKKIKSESYEKSI